MGTIGTTLDPLAQATYAEPWPLANRDRFGAETPARNGNGHKPAGEVLDEASLVQELTIAIATANTVEGAIELTLREICAVTGWAMGQAWTRNGGPYLECSPAWCASSERFASFRTRSESMNFGLDQGIPGRAWSAKRPVWVTDIAADPELPRASFAREVGINAGVAVPVLRDGEVVAVLEFLMIEHQEEDKRLARLVSTAAAQLGSLFQRKQAEDALRANEECFRMLVESMVDCAICKLDPSGQVASWNPGAARITGYGRDEVLGCHVSCFYTPEAVQAGEPERHLTLAREQGRYEECGWRVRSDGLRFWASVVITPLVDQDAKLRGYSHVILDATARKRTEDELLALRAVVECSDDAIVGLTPERGIITTWNAGAERLFGYAAREVIGRSATLLIPDQQHEQHAEPIEHALHLDHVEHYETRALRKNGSLVEIALTLSPMFDPDGIVVGVSAIARDISDRKCSEQRMESALGAYLDRRVADQILRDGPAPSGVEADVTVMFVDIRDFTALAEGIEPHAVVETLNGFFELAVPVITAHGGHVDKFIGDGLLAVFGLPGGDSHHADRALEAAIAIQRSAQERLEGCLEIGIGIHSGTVVVGNVGGGGRLDFTVIGDAVNTAARIEAATRRTGDTILFSEQTRLRMQDTGLAAAERPTVSIRGKREPVPLFAPLSGLPNGCGPAEADLRLI